MNRRIVHYHMPKTAGTSFSETMLGLGVNRMMLIEHSFHDSDKECYSFHIDDPSRPAQYVQVHEWCPSKMFSKFRAGPEDISFTIIREPVSLFYSFYHFSYNETRSKEFEWRTVHLNDQPLYRSILSKTQNIRQYIDIVLDSGDLFSEMIPPRRFYDRRFLDGLDFVGILEDAQGTFRRVAAEAGLPDAELMFSNKNEYERDLSYRRSELEEFLSDEMRVYDEFKERFHSNVQGQRDQELGEVPWDHGQETG